MLSWWIYYIYCFLKTNAVVVGTVGSLGVVIPAPNRRKKFYDSSIPFPMQRRVECNLHYEGPLTPAHLLKREVKFLVVT